MNPRDPQRPSNRVWLAASVLVTVSVSGYFMGLRQTGSQISMTRPVGVANPDSERRAGLESVPAPVAVAYASQDWLRDGVNGAWSSHLSHLAQPLPAAGPVPAPGLEERALALAARAARRAYDGAPPVVPHPISQESSASCLACHGPGLVMRGKVATKISHAPHASCTQCHVPSGGLGLQAGVSAWPAQSAPPPAPPHPKSSPVPGATLPPPKIPHATFMRGDCVSCHGPAGLFGLRTPHPERQSCLQCHVPDASLDQYHFSHATP